MDQQHGESAGLPGALVNEMDALAVDVLGTWSSWLSRSSWRRELNSSRQYASNSRRSSSEVP